MTFEIDVGGRTRTVSVERIADAPHLFRISYDGRTTHVDAVRIRSEILSLILLDRGNASYDVRFAPGSTSSEMGVLVGGATVQAVVNGRRARRGAASGATAGEQRIVAPMPGKVLHVLVEVGDEVAARQPLVVVEAMKMENELSCSRPGRVRHVAVARGESVEAGRLLVTVE